MRWAMMLTGLTCGGGAATALAGQGAPAGGVRVAGHVAILERGNDKTTDLSSAVVHLDGPHSASRPVTMEIAIHDKAFVPRVMVVPRGSTIRFTNYDPFDHNVFSVSDPTVFDLGQYGRGEGKSWTFTTPGLVQVYCNIHPRMVAYVQVVATKWFTQPAADGSWVLPDVVPGAYTLHVWHDRAGHVEQALTVPAAGIADVPVQLDARGFRWTPHKNKYGREYPTNAGRERY